MLIPCVSCDSMFRLDSIYVKGAGSKVRCSKCHEIFIAFPPDHNTENCPKKRSSNIDVAVVIPNVKHSLLDDLFQGESKPIAMATSAGKSDESDNSSIENFEPIKDFEKVEEDEDIEYPELPDLAEIEGIVDLILDEEDHLKNIPPHIKAKYSLTQELNFSGE